MPNYRKKNNKSKNKNLNQKNTTTTRTSSSRVKQEVSEFTSAGAEPNLPADVSFSRTSTTTIASTNVLEKDVVIVDDSLALSNEEIDANAACNVDIDTCSSDRKTVLTQSNCSPSSSECTFTSAATSTEIERNSARTISDGDSTFGNSAITDTFDAGTDINSIKTGSAHSKDAVVPIAATKSATRSVETTRKIDGNRTGLEGILDEGETTKDFSSKVIVRKAFKKESSTTSSAKEGDDDYEPVIIQQASKAIITGEAGITSGGSKVIVHKTFKSETKSSGRPGEDDHYETVIVQETPEGKTSKVIVHKYSKEGSPKPSVDVGKEVFPDSYPQKRVIVEESNTITHTESKLSADQSPIVITQKSPKKKATRSTTSSLQSSSTKEVSKENVQENSNNVQDSPPTPESIKVIVHQISKEEQLQQSNSSTENLDQSSEVIGTPSETADRRSEIIQETRNEASSEKHTKESSKVVVHQISTVNNPIGPTTQSEQSSKVIVHQITKEEVEQPTELETSLSKQQQPSSTVIVHQISTEEQQKTNVPRTSSTAQSEQSSKVIVHQISKEETQQPTELQTSLSKQQQPSSTVIVHQISAEDQQKTNVPPTSSTAQSEHSSRDIEQEISRKDTQKQTELQTSLSTQQQQSSKVIVHQISTEDHNKAPQIKNLQKPAADFVPQKVSKVILHQISKEGLVQDCPPGHPTNKKGIQHEDTKQSAFVGEEQISKVIVHQISKEDSSLAVNINKATDIALQKSIEGPKTTDELTNKSSSTEDHESKVIVHQISTEGSTTSQSKSSVEQTTQQNPTAVADQSPKVILHQFALDNSTQTTSSPLTTLPGGTTQNPLDEDLRQRRIFPSTPKEGSPSRVIVHPILQERSTQTELAEGKSAPAPPPRTAFPVSRSPKMIVHPIHQEGPPKSVFPFTPRSAKKLDQTSNEIAHEILKEASSELQSNLHQESVIRLAKEIPKGPVRTSFPVSTKGDGSIRPGFFEPAVVQPEVNPLDATDPKIIIRPILNEESIPVQNGFPMSSKHTSFPVSNRTDDLESVLEDLEMKVKLHQISLGKSNSTQSSTSSSTTSTSNGLQPKVIIHQILKEEPKTTETSFPISKKPNSLFSSSTSSTSMESASKNNDQTIVPESATKKSVDQQTSQDDSTSSLSSGESETTTILVKSPEPQSPSVLEDQQEKTITSEMSSSKEIIHKILQEVQEKREKSPPVVGKLIIHPILREIVQDSPQSYRVESPQPENRQLIVKKSKSFDDDDVVIQEMSDTSSAYDTDNPPVISEAESETDTMEAVVEYADTEINSRVLSVQTLPMDNEEENGTQMSPKTAQEYKVKRQQNRAALQSHFLPQYLSPIFLDSIKEENSDHSDTDRRSECSDRTDHAIQPDLDDDVFLEGGPHAKKADAVFPKSNLDFSKKHKHIHTNIRPPTTNAIREEASPPSMVEARIIDQVTVQEGCSSWSTDLTPECEAAEVVYIDSASSSVSDLLELDYSQGQADDSCDVRIQTPTIDLDSVNEMFAYRPASESDVPQPPVKDGENMSELTKTATDHVDTTTTLSSEKPTTTTQHQLPSEIILEKIETMSASTMANNNKDDDDVVSGVDGAQNSKEKISNSCDNAINPVVTKNGIPSVDVVGFIEKMENLRELVSASIKSELNTDSENVEKPNFKIGEPCSDYAFKCDTQTTTSSSSSSSSSSTTTTTTTTTSGTKILTLHDLSKTLDKTQHLHPLINSSSALDRQNSLDSHASDQSQSTNQSQCTAINQGSLPHTDWNEIDTSTDTTYVSETDTAGLASSENSSPNTTGRLTDDTESPPIRKLRSLCTETLASLPYGQEVLEELATVAQTIGEMPYPLPELPHIQDIQVSLGSTEQKNSSVIHLTQVPPRPVEVGQKMKSPPPPPVPAPPSKYDSWLGVPTESDPSVLVCLSPSQRGGVKDDSTPDSLLDMHKKFVERRGYHEYTTKQVDAMNKEKISETVKLSNSSLPPPLPPRQPQAPTQATKSNGDETETDENNHRLLAIIRDTHGGQQQQQHNHRQSSSENISRRTESGTTTTTTTTTTNTDGGGGHEEFANSPSVGKQTQEQQFVGESNKSQSANHKMQKEQTDIKVDRESVLGLRFPTSEYFDSIFHDTNKRFSNIETKSSPNFCSQILSTQPKRYSNIETSTFESRKCVENGKVLYDVSDSSRQTVTEGEKDPKSFPEFQSSGNGFPVNSETATTKTSSNQSDSRTQITGDSEKIMSAFKLNTQTTAPSAIPPANRAETSPPAPPVPPLPTTIADTNAASMKSTSTTTSESVINRTSNSERKETVFDEFRQRAKEASAGTRNVFDHEKLFKDFDELSNLLKDELDSGKRRPPATLNGAEIPSAVRDYNRVAKESKTTTSSHTTTTESSRKEQMKMLADEIDRTSRERQMRKEMRIPIQIEKSTPAPPRSAPADVQQPRTYEIPVRVENGGRSLHQQRSYEIPVRVENQAGTRQRTYSEHHTSHEAPVKTERPTEQPSRFRRAESMFNVSDSSTQRHMHHDDWMKYVGDLGSSENICKPFQREVEICYLGRRPNIRAPRMSASTSDLSSNYSFDTHGAYDVRRTNNQTPRPQQPPPRRYQSTQSMIDTTPITSCVSSHRTPAPDRKRRSSLPREIHDQQMKYISSKEHQLQIEFERLENERRALIDEMNRAQINQRMNREAYRQRQLPPLTEDESFRQQMAEEWLNKVAEREERRLQKIIKISKINQDANIPVAPLRHVSTDDIGDEFLRRVKERRSKLHMPPDSDWESGAESQPIPRNDGSRSENEDIPVTILEGLSEASIRELPKHLREFAKLATQMKEERREETTENSSCSATKKSTIQTTVKTTSNSTNANLEKHDVSQSLSQQDARVRDLEQLSQGKRQKLVTILRQKKPTESSGCQPSVGTAGGETTTAGNSANSSKRRKQTRFLLTPNRRSWSESDLLREIDKELVLARGFLYANVYSVKNEYMSEPETEYEKPKKMAQLSRRQYDGIGPTTQHGMPVVLRSEVKEPNQHEWYKRIFQTIHKQKNPDDYVTIRYKCPRGRYPYKSNGYMSEPEPNYDSDYSTVKYRTLERRRLQSTGQPSENFKGPSTGAGAVPNDSQVDTVYGTMPNPVKSGQGSYKVQPGRIEDYITGHSSVSEKEKKEWWDEVMDIFNGQLDQQKLSPHYTEGNLSRALLKEQGYTSDSNLVFRKKDVPQHQSPLSPVEQKQVYRSVQSGGQPPLLGFRKPAPEKPKESPNRYFESDVNIHYKTPIRYEYKDPIPEEELAIRQAESMQKLYQEERRRKYLQELQDMNSRRHTDNFTPTQKSPIPLNRYDDFNSDLAPKSPNSSSYPKTIARALYNFQGQTARELTFKKGDVIYIRRQIDKNWFEGEHNAMIGLLPSNYVELITKDGVRQPPKRPSEGQARAKYNFQAQSGIELSLNKGEHVTLTRRVDDNWYEGKIANRKGIFPVSYVEVLVDIGAEDKMGRQQPASQSIITQSSSSVRPSLDTLRTNINNEFNTITSNGQQPPNGILRETRTLHKTEVLHVDTNTEPVAYRALYKYRPQNTDELELQEGDIVYVLEKCDDGWFVGTSQRNGCFGTFPGNYVERV